MNASFTASALHPAFDVIFLGGGPAGYVGAIRAAQLGLSVGVIEREGLGGTCVLWGCIPAKALLEAASLATKVKHAAEFGVNVGEVKLDFGVAMKRSRDVSNKNSKGVELNKITWIKGTGTLGAGKTVPVTADGKSDTHTATKGVVISTGSRVRGLPQAGLELNKTTVISSDEALILEKAPKTIAIVGAGAVGCEFADVFAAFGSKVTLIEVMVGAKMTAAQVGKSSVKLSIEAGGALTDRGFIKINERMETSAKGVYAIGDVAGPPMLAHKGEREGMIVADVIAGKKFHPLNYGNVPNATYCHPEVASIGLTEAQVKEKKIDYKVGKFPFSASGRARTSGETEGFVKIIRDSKSGGILSAHIVGAHATELIHELAVARENEFTVEEIDLAIHAHPTLSGAVAEAALDSMGRMIHA